MIRFLQLLIWLSAAGSLAGSFLLLARRVLGLRIPVLFWHAAWILVFIRLALPVSGLIPGWNIHRSESFSPVAAKQAWKQEYTVEAPAGAVSGSVPDFPEYAPRESISAAPAYSEPERTESFPAREKKSFPVGVLLSSPQLWFFIWLAGAAGIFLRHLVGYQRFLLLLRPMLRSVSADHLSWWNALPGRKPSLMESPGIRTPMLVGFLHPKILLPEGMASDGSIHSVLSHELTHFRRGDLILKWFSVLVSSLHWFNPLMRLFRSELDRVIELSCDADVLRRLTRNERSAYGEALLDVAAQRPLSRRIVSISFATEKHNLKERLVQIMQYRTPKKSILVILAALLLLLGGCLYAAGPAEVSVQNEEPDSSVSEPVEISPASGFQEAGPAPTLPPDMLPAPVSVDSDATASEEAVPSGRNEVTVSDINTFLQAIGPNTTILLAPGDYDLTKAAGYGSLNPISSWYYWVEAFDGYELNLAGVSNLEVRSLSGNPADVRIVTRPRYANVLALQGCSEVFLSGITAGHSVEAGQGECVGGVVSMSGSSDITIQNCSLYGCGVLAVNAENCSGIRVSESDLYDCSYGAAQLYSSRDIIFSGCSIYDCGEETDDPYSSLISASSCYGVAVLDSTISGNRTATVLSCDYSDEVYFLGNTVNHPHIGRNSAVFQIFGSPIIVDGCAFTGSAVLFSDPSSSAMSPDFSSLSYADLAYMVLSPSDFQGFRGSSQPEISELTPEEAAALPLPASASGVRTVKVSNIDEFLAAIAPDTVIYMEEGTYNLSRASGYGTFVNDYYLWENPYDGPGLVLTDLHGLQIVGAGKDKTFLVAEPRYVDVLSFSRCSDIVLDGLTAGHTAEPGECIGGVLMFRECSGIALSGCGLFGCGIRGITAEQTQEMVVRDCEIYSCSLGAVQLENCTSGMFEGNSIHDCAYPTYQLYSCKGILLDGSALSANESLNLPNAGPYRKAG